MTISLARCFSDHERVDKNVQYIETTTAHIKEDTSIVDPTFIMVNPGTVNFNYVSVPEWGRKYYVRDITALPGERLAVSCHCDVLSSFADGIRAASAIIDKQENDNMTSDYINDGSYVMLCKSVNQSYNFPMGFNSRSTILITAGGN